MPIPTPEAGLVISYAYLWHYEHQAGQDEGRKDRPSVIVLAVERAPDNTVVTVLPITHKAPANPGDAIEIPLLVKRHLTASARKVAPGFRKKSMRNKSLQHRTGYGIRSDAVGSTTNALGLSSLKVTSSTGRAMIYVRYQAATTTITASCRPASSCVCSRLSRHGIVTTKAG